jgi:hypothetical protein
MTRMRICPYFISLKKSSYQTNPFFGTIIDGTATLIAGKNIPIGLDSFKEIVDRGSTIITKHFLFLSSLNAMR